MTRSALRKNILDNPPTLAFVTMPNEILSLGLPQETVSAISNRLCARIYVAGNLAEVPGMLDSYDISCIVVNATKCPNPTYDVTKLLGHTPLTTRIVLLCDSAAELDFGKLCSMGIKTLSASTQVDELVEALRR